jgi:hypothetical protein
MPGVAECHVWQTAPETANPERAFLLEWSTTPGRRAPSIMALLVHVTLVPMCSLGGVGRGRPQLDAVDAPATTEPDQSHLTLRGVPPPDLLSSGTSQFGSDGRPEPHGFQLRPLADPSSPSSVAHRLCLT